MPSGIHPFDAGGSGPIDGAESPTPFGLRLEPMPDNWVRVWVEGELVLTSSSVLELAVVQELEGKSHVLLDLSRVEFIDSSGLRAMTGLVRTAKANGRKLRLSADLPPHVRRLMEIVGLLPFVPIADDNYEDGASPARSG